MVYTISDLVTYARSRDERLADVVVYPDTKVKELLEEAFAAAQDIRAIFAAHETYDLEANVATNGLTEMEVILQKEPHTIREIVDYDTSFFDVTVTANNHILIKVTGNSDRPDDDNYKITVKYFYYPLMPLDVIELSVDAYRLVKETIGAVVCAELRDYEQETYHRNKAKQLAGESAYDLEKGTLDYPDDRLWRGSWV